ncbi:MULTISPECIES: ABC transporter permease [Acidiphilium]|uniref:ABC transporter permease n=1 Tax=Acidiphilium TaxID=522 RepID=UPI00021450E3|nr:MULTISPECIES: ABC transporter permease [Acidiphilium]EGO96752.1 RbsC [Acidiphilium sp. PM]
MTNLDIQPNAGSATLAPRRLGIGRLLPDRRRLAGMILWIAFAFYVIPLSIAEPNFISLSNILSILLLTSVYALIAFGESLVILTAGIDLSVGSIVGLSGVVAALLIDGHSSAGWVLLSVFAGIAAGAAVGLFNGVLVAYVNLPSFVTTLGTLSMALGVAYVISSGRQISIDNNTFLNISGGRIFEIPTPIVIIFCAFAVLWGYLTYSRWGRFVYAVGGNLRAAYVAGLPVRKILLSVYVISGALAGLAGVILSSEVTVGVASNGSGYELVAIAAPVIGGISLAGGRGSLFGTLFGVVLLGTIDNGMTILNVSPFYQHIIRGAIIVVAVSIDILVNKRRLV